ncbi:hypothetical protein K2X05_14240 [bacterium]|nr:hypothetical protein [bacterium]
MIFVVHLSKTAQKQIQKLPSHIVIKLMAWIESVNMDGVEEVRKIPGFHDEPLRGQRTGQRSIRLNSSYRAIYIIKSHKIEFVEVLEVNKHDY